jgi:hypothetical protein
MYAGTQDPEDLSIQYGTYLVFSYNNVLNESVIFYAISKPNRASNQGRFFPYLLQQENELLKKDIICSCT